MRHRRLAGRGAPVIAGDRGWIVAWAPGGSGCTRSGLARNEAVDLARRHSGRRAYLIRRDEAGVPRLALTGKPLPSEHAATLRYLMSVVPAGKPGAWQAEAAGVVPGGDTGGDLQAGESFSVRFRRSDRPFAVLTRTACPCQDGRRGRFFVQVQTEFLVCAEPFDPGGTEIWSDMSLTDLPRAYRTASQAETAARDVAEEMLRDASLHVWDGRVPWEAA